MNASSVNAATRTHAPMPDDSEQVAIEQLSVAAYTIPTETPESDGTLEWNSTTLVLVEITADGVEGIGYSYTDRSAAVLIHDHFATLLTGKNALAIPARWNEMVAHIRNLGRPGIAATAISAVDNALWDWKAKYFAVPLVDLLGAARNSIEIYGSGGFTSYTDTHLQRQLGNWAERDFRAVKMKIGRAPLKDIDRVKCARNAIGADVELYVDANGAYSRKVAAKFAQEFVEQQISWFEEPVSSDDLAGLRWLRDVGPAGMAITAGEYGYDTFYFREMLEADAVDVLQADATRCCGLTGFLRAAALSDAFQLPLSSHCAPAIHLHAMCAIPRVARLEYFFDHTRIEELFFDGVAKPVNGRLAPDRTRPGLGIEFKREAAECYRV